MIKELVQFVDSIGPEFKAIGIKPKEGLHVLLNIRADNARMFIDDRSLTNWCFTRKKDPTPSDINFLKRCAALTQVSWCVNTNKCFDLPIKAIHSCSPYCIALKRENLIGGEKYNNNTKAQVYDRIKSYFEKASTLLDSEGEKQRIKLFAQALASADGFNHWFTLIPDYSLLKDSDYVIFYLDEPIEKYETTNLKYLADKLFNTNDYNKSIENELFGTSDFFNGYPTKKPFLTHRSAYFDIASLISAKDARSLYDFQELIGRGILPRPLPIFIHEDEIQEKNKRSLKDASIALLKTGAANGGKIGYQEIMKSLYEDYKDQLGNYYLLFYTNGLIKDFDFVSKFEYQINAANNRTLEVQNLFGIKKDGALDRPIKINSVFDFQDEILPIIFNNSLVVVYQKGNLRTITKYFDEIEAKYCKTEVNFLLIMKYRKAFYDFVFKSKRHAVTQLMFDEIMQSNILEDMRQDKYENEKSSKDYDIRQKLNVWFSLYEFFFNNIKRTKTMINEIEDLNLFIGELANGNRNIQSDQEFGFALGQLIRYINRLHESSDRSYARVKNSYMTKKTISDYKQVLSKDISAYMYKIKDSKYSIKFDRLLSQVMLTSPEKNINELMPYILGGMFAPSVFLTGQSAQENNLRTTENDIINN